jgi:hypothetical protein
MILGNHRGLPLRFFNSAFRNSISFVGAGPCACPDFGQTPREIAKGEWRKAKKQIAKGGRRIAKMRNGDPSFRNPQFAFRNPPVGAGLV